MNEPHFEVFPERSRSREIDGRATGPLTGQFVWHFQDANGKITFIGGEPFTRREDAHRSIEGTCIDVLRDVFGYRDPETAAVLVKHMPPTIVDLDENGEVIAT